MNLLQETLEAIREAGKQPSDIVFIGSRTTGYQCSWDEFKALADVDYDCGFGAQEVASDLEFVFSEGSRLERQEYDGSEGWRFVGTFIPPANSKPIHRLTVVGTDKVGWCTLHDLNADLESTS